MKAIVFREINAIPNIENIELSTNGIRLDLMASAFNHRDLWITKGLYPNLQPGTIMGSDGMGIYNGDRYIVNPGLDWGDNEKFQNSTYRVLGVPDHGTFADHIYLAQNQLSIAPEHLSNEEAASLPVAGITAYRALFKKCNLKSTDNVLITGIGGGVALTAALFAKAIGANVYFTTGDDDKIKKALSLGFSAGANYKTDMWEKQIMEASGGIDVVIDSAAGSGFASLVKLCNYGARIAFYGGTNGKINGLNPQLIFWKQISIFGTTMGSDADFDEMLNFVSTHNIKPIISEILPFDEYKKAFEILEKGSQFGKIVLAHTQ
jgi:zinc-binding alcohol dehydrogenase/oxidoreductase